MRLNIFPFRKRPGPSPWRLLSGQLGMALVALTLLASATFCVLAITWAMDQSRHGRDAVAREASAVISQRVQNEVDRCSSVALRIASSIAQGGDYRALARRLLDTHPGITSIIIAPKGQISDAFPTGSAPLGASLLENPDTRLGAILARQDRRQFVLGPSLSQDRLGFGIITPVYAGAGEDGSGATLWGYTKVEAHAEGVVGAEALEGYFPGGAGLWIWQHGAAGGRDYLYSSAPVPPSGIARSRLIAFGLSARLGTAPRAGFGADPRLWLDIAAIGLCGLLLPLLAYLLIALRRCHGASASLSLRDPVTGLYNIRKYLATLNELDEQDIAYAVILAEMRDFSPLSGADSAKIASMSRRMMHCLRPSDLAFRTGDDELAFIIKGGLDQNTLGSVVDRLFEAASEPRLRMGMARCPEDGGEHHLVLVTAKQRLYGRMVEASHDE
ncbi:MAG: hypothetical protein K6A65_08470 [Succinivibrionaceae bacterium]|nr:hypothetical protein [Succinivibrionaceae bacterium]